jgi:hypothetical protein
MMSQFIFIAIIMFSLFSLFASLEVDVDRHRVSTIFPIKRSQLRGLYEREKNKDVEKFIHVMHNSIYNIVFEFAKQGEYELKFDMVCDDLSDLRFVETGQVCIICDRGLEQECMWGVDGYILWDLYIGIEDNYKIAMYEYEDAIIRRVMDSFPDADIEKTMQYFVLSWN